MLRLALIGLALALVALAGVQGPLLRVVKFPAALRERRAELATAGIAILIGIGAARLL